MLKMGVKLLIVGAGLTGSLTAALLQRICPGLSVTVWDKARGAGGRMSTHRDPNHPNLHVDMGAQYISRSAGKPHEDRELESLKEQLYEELISNETFVPFSGRIDGERDDLKTPEQYVSPKGMNSITKHFLQKSKADVLYQQQLAEINIESSEQGGKISCKCVSGDCQNFDSVILTLPVPQFLRLQGNLTSALDQKTLSDLSAVKYSSRYALGVFYEKSILADSSAMYFDDPVIRFLAWDTAKRGGGDSGSSLLLHTSVPFGIQHLEDDKEEVKVTMLKRLGELVKGLPQPDHTHLIRWRYSQVSQAYPGSPGCLVLSRDPLVVITGDGFSDSNFENCIRAAQVTTRTVVEKYK